MDMTIKVDVPGEQAILAGAEELWITVTGPDPLPDFTKIRTMLREQYGRDDIPAQPLRYFPAWGGPNDPYEELWVVRRVA